MNQIASGSQLPQTNTKLVSYYQLTRINSIAFFHTPPFPPSLPLPLSDSLHDISCCRLRHCEFASMLISLSPLSLSVCVLINSEAEKCICKYSLYMVCGSFLPRNSPKFFLFFKRYFFRAAFTVIYFQELSSRL